MATKKGPPKHQNTHAWKSDKWKTDNKTKVLQNLKVQKFLCFSLNLCFILGQKVELFMNSENHWLID